MVAAILLILVFSDTFATGYLVALFGRVRKSQREHLEELAGLAHDVDCLAEDVRALRDELK